LEQGGLGLWHEFVWTPWLCHNRTPMKTCVFVLSSPRGLTPPVSGGPPATMPKQPHKAYGVGRLFQWLVRPCATTAGIEFMFLAHTGTRQIL
jgi:hypothetical protein